MQIYSLITSIYLRKLTNSRDFKHLKEKLIPVQKDIKYYQNNSSKKIFMTKIWDPRTKTWHVHPAYFDEEKGILIYQTSNKIFKGNEDANVGYSLPSLEKRNAVNPGSVLEQNVTLDKIRQLKMLKTIPNSELYARQMQYNEGLLNKNTVSEMKSVADHNMSILRFCGMNEYTKYQYFLMLCGAWDPIFIDLDLLDDYDKHDNKNYDDADNLES